MINKNTGKLSPIAASAVAGGTFTSALFMGFGVGDANGDQVSTLIGGAASGAVGVTVPLFFTSSDATRAEAIQNFDLGIANPIDDILRLLGIR